MGKIINYDIEYDPVYGYYKNYSKSLKVNSDNDSFKVDNLQEEMKSTVENDNTCNRNSCYALLDYNGGRIYTDKFLKYNHFYKLYDMEIIFCKIKYNFIDLEERSYGNSLKCGSHF